MKAKFHNLTGVSGRIIAAAILTLLIACVSYGTAQASIINFNSIITSPGVDLAIFFGKLILSLTLFLHMLLYKTSEKKLQHEPGTLIKEDTMK